MPRLLEALQTAAAVLRLGNPASLRLPALPNCIACQLSQLLCHQRPCTAEHSGGKRLQCTLAHRWMMVAVQMAPALELSTSRKCCMLDNWPQRLECSPQLDDSLVTLLPPVQRERAFETAGGKRDVRGRRGRAVALAALGMRFGPQNTPGGLQFM